MSKRTRRMSLKWGYLPFVAAVTIVVAIGLTLVLQNRPRAQNPTTTASSGAIEATVGVRVGNLAPEFRVVDMNGTTLTRASLVSGKPGLMFFTATWCFPCIVGLQNLVKFQQDVGGDPFNVLVVFVDPTETNDLLRAYRDRFLFPKTWFYALDTDQMVVEYGIRFLDTKFVLDRNGIVRFADVYPANYDTWRRALATVGVRP